MSERSLKEVAFAALRGSSFFPSPAAWEDQVLYFLLLDRFSDGKEHGYKDNAGNLVTDGSTPYFNSVMREMRFRHRTMPNSGGQRERSGWAVRCTDSPASSAISSA